MYSTRIVIAENYKISLQQEREVQVGQKEDQSQKFYEKKKFKINKKEKETLWNILENSYIEFTKYQSCVKYA